MDLSVIQSVETASTKAAVTVGVNALLMSGKETGIINAPLNVCEVKTEGHKGIIINLNKVSNRGN